MWMIQSRDYINKIYFKSNFRVINNFLEEYLTIDNNSFAKLSVASKKETRQTPSNLTREINEKRRKRNKKEIGT